MRSVVGSSPEYHGFYEETPVESVKAFRVDVAEKIPSLGQVYSPEHKA